MSGRRAWGPSLWALLAALVLSTMVLAPIGLGDPTLEAQRSHATRTRRRSTGAHRTTRRRGSARRASTRRVRPRLTAAQRRQIRRWHQRPSHGEVQVWQRREPPPLVFRPLHLRERFELVPASDEGGFDGEDLSLAERAFVYRDDGTTHAIHPRLIDLVYRAVRHFHAPYVYVISGYRNGRPSSRHAQGRAIDFVLPGVPDRRLASYLRPQGFVGVGIYPTSGFVHLDVRARSYFWSDSSGPGQQNRERAILRTLPSRYDRIARALGAEPTPDVVFAHADASSASSADESELSEESEVTIDEAVETEAREEDDEDLAAEAAEMAPSTTTTPPSTTTTTPPSTTPSSATSSASTPRKS